MSIWGTFGGAAPLYQIGYGWDPAAVEPGRTPGSESYLDLADSSHYAGRAIRICMETEDGAVCAVVSREQAQALAAQLQAWLALDWDDPADRAARWTADVFRSRIGG